MSTQPVYCVDTNVVIWAIKQQATPGQEQMVAKAQKLLNKLVAEKGVLLLPTVVLAEALIKPDDDQTRLQLVKEMSRAFLVAPFDVQAAVEFARLWNHARRSMSVAGGKPSDPDYTRTELKADLLILATAIAARATHMVAGDRRLLEMSKPWMQPVPVQGNGSTPED